jgi:hypothetical protein
VTTNKIKDDAVTTSKIGNGAVTAAKLDSGVTALLDGAAQNVTVNCLDESVQAAIDAAASNGHLTITINGTCNENLLIRRDDVTLRGGAAGVIVGQAGVDIEAAIQIETARNVLIDNLSVSGGALSGILGIDGAVFFVESCFVESNALEGIVVDLGSSAVIESSTITNNGAGSLLIDVGVGIKVRHGASAEIDGNTVEDNNADGIDVLDGAFAFLENNSIKRNGRAGVAVSRAVVRGLGNTYLDNSAAAVEVYNVGSYRTGSWITGAGRIDNDGPFESISAGPGQFAVDVGQQSFVDLRQVNVFGPSQVGHMSMLQVRGDNVGPSQTCSTMDNGAGNAVDVFGANSVVRFDFVNVTGTVTGSGTVIGLAACP